MVARVRTLVFQGVETLPVDVQVQIGSGLVGFTIVGLPDKAVAESRERVRAALLAIGLSLPAKRITINLAPADLLKEGSHFDLPIALAVLVAMGIVPQDAVDGQIVLGELALDGRVAPVAGTLAAAIAASSAGLGLICPAAGGPEAVWAGEALSVLAPPDLLTLIQHFQGTAPLARPSGRLQDTSAQTLPDLRDIRGQEQARRALEIAAAGGHHLLLVGPPGAGKSMLAARLPGILPPLSPAEALDVTMVHSLAGQLADAQLLRRRPFRDPHHSASMPALVGGGLRARPGEISLAHLGVLFLDELPEFSRQTLEALRQPLETGNVVIARANAHVRYPARFQLVAAMNPCRCGWLDDPARGCGRAPRCAGEYQARLSGPLLDRIDIQITVPAVAASDLSLPANGDSSAIVAARVAAARQRQQERFATLGAPHLHTNAEAQGDVLDSLCTLDSDGRSLLAQAAEKFRLSARAYHRVLRVARTIADLDGQAQVARPHLAEALHYRRLEFAA